MIRDVLAGWNCDAGDNLVEQVRLKAATIQPKFADALKLLTNLHTPQPDRVDEGDPRGNAYRR